MKASIKNIEQTIASEQYRPALSEEYQELFQRLTRHLEDTLPMNRARIIGDELRRVSETAREADLDCQKYMAALSVLVDLSLQGWIFDFQDHQLTLRMGNDNIDDKEKIRYRLTDSNLNHTGIYLYSKGKIMIHLTFDYKTDEKCTTPGQYLKYHRTFQGLSTRELAEKVGIVPATLVLYENDRHPIKYSTAVALANVLGIDRNRLLDEYTAFVDYPYFSLLKKVRQDLSLTQIQMAELIGIGQTSYSGWEREIRVPRRKEYDKILAALKKLRVNVDTYLCQSASI